MAVMVVVYAHRIQAEEAMLLAMNPRYSDYRARTWRLVPFVYQRSGGQRSDPLVILEFPARRTGPIR